MKLRIIKGGYPIVLNIDGANIDATVSRFTIDQRTDFMRGFQRTQDPHSDRMVAMRFPGEETEKRELETGGLKGNPVQVIARQSVERLVAEHPEDAGLTALAAIVDKLAALEPTREEFVIPELEIRRRRLVEMTAAQRAAYEAQRSEDESFSASFIADSLAKHLTLAPGQIAETHTADDGSTVDVDITSGAEFVRIFGGREDLLLQALRAIYQENTLPEAVKNALSSRRVSQRSSVASELTPTTEVPGLRPEAPAMNAASERSVTSADATATSAPTTEDSQAQSNPLASSGSTAAETAS